MNIDLEVDSLFGDIEVPEAPAPRLPLGGVHVKVIEANGISTGAGMWWPASVTARWEVTSKLKIKGWKSRLTNPCTLTQVEDRLVRAEVETIVSRVVHGVWRTGASDLDRDAVVQILLRQGYEPETDRSVEHERIETFRLTR